MKKVVCALVFSSIILSCTCAKITRLSEKDVETLNEKPRVVLGDERSDRYLPLLKDRRVALFSNHTGITGGLLSSDDNENCGKHILDYLLEQNVNVTALFGPEHGFRGLADAGEEVLDSIDDKTGIPVFSLYTEKSHYPSKSAMDSFDLLVADIQDVGLRYYTYYISLFYLMEACAKNSKKVVIFDRPNPNGFYVDGAILKEEYKSNVGLLPIPAVHGMTLGELARMINGEGWLSTGKNSCDLTVIPCKNYNHQTRFELVIPPSPNLKSMRAIYLYSSTCFFENTLVSVGRGTDFPFEVYGSPLFKLGDFEFIPQSRSGAKNPPFENLVCSGNDLRDKAYVEIWKEGCNLNYLIEAYRSCPKEMKADFWGLPDSKNQYWIDKLSGSDQLRKMIVQGESAKAIKKSWQLDLEKFKKQRKPYLLYSEEESPDWQLDESFPDWIKSSNFTANNIRRFDFYRGQGSMILTLSPECRSFSLYINDKKVPLSGLKAGSYQIDISKFTRNGINTLQVSDVLPHGIKNAVQVQIPYPELKGKGSDSDLKNSGISRTAFKIIEKIIESDVKAGFPGAQLAVIKDGDLVYKNAWGGSEGMKVTDQTLFDLASVTKMFSVNYAIQYLASQGLLDVSWKISDILGDDFYRNTIEIIKKERNKKGKKVPRQYYEQPDIEKIREWKKNITIRDVMAHTAGFPSGYPYYNDRADLESGEFNGDSGINPLYYDSLPGDDKRQKTLQQIFRSPLTYEPGTKFVYSDVDYMILCFVIEKLTETRIDVFLREVFWDPLKLDRITYCPLENGFTLSDCAPTDTRGNTWGGYINFAGVRRGLLHGQAHDANAFYPMEGISGHAGLFSNAEDLARLAYLMLTGGQGRQKFFTKNVIEYFSAPQSLPYADYGLGWWRQAEIQTPRHFGSISSSSVFGHQGFTGTLSFIDPEKELVIIYLTNKINSPMIKGREMANQFEGGCFMSGVPGFVPQIIELGLEENVSAGQWKSLLYDMADDARKRAEEESPSDKKSACWRAFYSLEQVYKSF